MEYFALCWYYLVRIDKVPHDLFLIFISKDFIFGIYSIFIIRMEGFVKNNSITWLDYELVKNYIYKKLPLPGFEPGFSEPQSEVLTTILQ